MILRWFRERKDRIFQWFEHMSWPRFRWSR